MPAPFPRWSQSLRTAGLTSGLTRPVHHRRCLTARAAEMCAACALVARAATWFESLAACELPPSTNAGANERLRRRRTQLPAPKKRNPRARFCRCARSTSRKQVRHQHFRRADHSADVLPQTERPIPGEGGEDKRSYDCWVSAVDGIKFPVSNGADVRRGNCDRAHSDVSLHWV